MIQQASRRGLLAGYPNRQFRPNQPITRVQALTILAKAQRLTVPSGIDDILIAAFDDQVYIPAYARGAIAAAAQANLVVNYPKLSELRPEALIARSEVAALLCQARATTLEAQYRVPFQYVVQLSADNNVWQQAKLLKETSNKDVSETLSLRDITILKNKIFFFAGSSKNNEINTPASFALWTTDGTTTGTQPIKDRILVDAENQWQSILPTFMGVSNQRLWFTTQKVQSDRINAIWSSDGTTAGITEILSLSPELAQTSEQNRLYAQPNVFLNENFVFSLVTPTETQLWQSDGQSHNQQLGQFPNAPTQGETIPGLVSDSFTSTGKQLFFLQRDTQNGGVA